MISLKPEIPLCQLEDKIETKSHQLCQCFLGPVSNLTIENMVQPIRSGKSKIVSFKPEVPISHFVDKIETKFQQLY